MSHTPGPWRLDGIKICGADSYADVDGFTIATVHDSQRSPRFAAGIEPNEREANARLIVEAPELLEEVKQFHFAYLHGYINEDFIRRWAEHAGTLLARIEPKAEAR